MHKFDEMYHALPYAAAAKADAIRAHYGTYDAWLRQQLEDVEFAAEFLNAASEDDDAATYLTALRKVVEARGGMAVVAQRTRLSRETLYRTLSSDGNPTIKTLAAVLRATGLALNCRPSTGVPRRPRPTQRPKKSANKPANACG